MNRDEATKKLQEIIGKDLVKIAAECGVTLFKDGKKNKGWVGHVVECHLGLPRNCLQLPDFGDWELKTISMKKMPARRLSVGTDTLPPEWGGGKPLPWR